MKSRRVLVTGGAGFIGSCLVKMWLREDPKIEIVNLDKLAYAGDLARLKEIENEPRHRFVRGDVANPAEVEKAMAGCDGVVHTAAETHVDRSLLDAKAFIDTNVYGTYVLLEAARKAGVRRFLTVSTDEVYGSRPTGFFKEGAPMAPTSPYSVSKTASDLLTLSYTHTHGLPTVVTRGSNTYGNWQYPEKVIPLFISNAFSDKKLPLYGDGKQVRNWMHVDDHARAILVAFKKGKAGEAYNVSSSVYLRNIDLTRRILKLLGKSEALIERVTDRAGHDRRYAIDSRRLRALGWKERVSFEKGLTATVDWYRVNAAWWRGIKEKNAFGEYYLKTYGDRRRG